MSCALTAAPRCLPPLPRFCAQGFSNASRYDVIGPPVAIEATPTALVVPARATDAFRGLNQTLAVYTVDRRGQRVLQYDPRNRSITASLRRVQVTVVAHHQVRARWGPQQRGGAPDVPRARRGAAAV